MVTLHYNLLGNIGNQWSVWMFIAVIVLYAAVYYVFARKAYFIIRQGLSNRDNDGDASFGAAIGRVLKIIILLLFFTVVSVWILFYAHGPGEETQPIPAEHEGMNEMMEDFNDEMTQDEIEKKREKERSSIDIEFENRINNKVDHDEEIRKAVENAQKMRNGQKNNKGVKK